MSSKLTHKIWDYKSSGVDIKAGNDLVERIKPIAARTHRAEVMAGLGGFASLFALPKGYQNPVLVSGTDGVGTKLKLATQLGIHNTIGIDLVAMCVNDIVVFGAAPLFFLDYYASGKLDVAVAASVVEGIGYGCELAGAALIGGETAEMPGMYSNGDYDLAGFCVGIVEKDRIIDGSRVAAGDKLIALAASGAHSNGYSLIRKVLDQAPSRPTTEALLAPTKIYAKSLLKLLKTITPHAIAHITGGGLNENLPRVLPSGCDATVDLASWQLPDIFRWLMTCGNIAEDEMLSTFNCGVGMVLVVASGDLDAALAVLADAGESAFGIGEITSATGAAKVTYKGALQ